MDSLNDKLETTAGTGATDSARPMSTKGTSCKFWGTNFDGLTNVSCTRGKRGDDHEKTRKSEYCSRTLMGCSGVHG